MSENTHPTYEVLALRFGTHANRPARDNFLIDEGQFTRGSDMCILICGDEPYRYATELGVDVSDVTVAFAVDERLSIGMIA